MTDDSVTRVRVETGAPYDVVIGHRLLGELPAMLGAGVRRVAVIHPEGLAATGEAIRVDLAEQGFEASCIQVPNGEERSAEAVEALLERLLRS